MIDATQIGHRLRSARERNGISQQAVADAMELPRTAVTNIESGSRSVSTLELTRLAQLYRCSPASFLDGVQQEEDASVVFMRALQGRDAPTLRDAIDRVLLLCREGAALRRLLGQEVEEDLPDYVGRLGKAGDAIRQGEQTAREERQRLGLGHAPIGNIAELLSGQGIWVAACHMPEEMSGLFAHDKRIGLAIVVNAWHGAVRRRFSYAHEYGHALFDRGEPFRITERANAEDLVEKRANTFAASFLMPADGIEDQLRRLDKGQPSRKAQIVYDVANDAPTEAEIRPREGSQTITYLDVRAIARRFGVSYESAVWRLRNLDHLNAAAANTLLAQKDLKPRLDDILKMSVDDIQPPPDREETELPNQIVRLAVEAFRRGEISHGRLRELATGLNLRADALIELAEAACTE
jgi:Zn-dependent peptidase ImmA (M78 family)/DNA-binding XRE family transcriptional regulator